MKILCDNCHREIETEDLAQSLYDTFSHWEVKCGIRIGHPPWNSLPAEVRLVWYAVAARRWNKCRTVSTDS